MTDNPPGWHPDPRGRHEHRFWDGNVWTDHVADQGAMSMDPLDAVAEPIAAPIGPSMVNLPAITPGSLAGAGAPAPAPQQQQPPPQAAQPAQPSQPAQPVTSGAAGLAGLIAHRPLSLAAVLSVIVPGTGHLFLGVQGQRRNIALTLLGVTVAAVVLMYFQFLIGLLLWIAAVAYALFDLRAELAPLTAANSASGPLGLFADLGPALAWRLVAAGGVLLALSLVLPWYHADFGNVSVNISGFDAFGVIDLVLLAVAVLAVLAGVMNIQGSSGNWPSIPQLGLIVLAAGAVAALLVAFRLIIVPGGGLSTDIGRALGGLLAYASALLITTGAAGGVSRT